jgi:mannose-6-phosphate isomerase-like protein (cupin superfamily)
MTTQTHEDGLGGSITILEPGSETAPMRFRMILAKGSGPPAPEYHPAQTEDFRVLRGTLDLGKIDGKRVLLRAGETYHVPAGTYHLPTNGGDDELEIESTLAPGRVSADMFAALYQVTRDHRGLARFARVAMVMRRFARVITFAPPVSAVMCVVAGLARLFGVRLEAERLPSRTARRTPAAAPATRTRSRARVLMSREGGEPAAGVRSSCAGAAAGSRPQR